MSTLENTIANCAPHGWAISYDITKHKDRTYDDNHNHRITHTQMENTSGKIDVFSGLFLLRQFFPSNPPAPTPQRYDYTLIISVISYLRAMVSHKHIANLLGGSPQKSPRYMGSRPWSRPPRSPRHPRHFLPCMSDPERRYPHGCDPHTLPITLSKVHSIIPPPVTEKSSRQKIRRGLGLVVELHASLPRAPAPVPRH